MFPANLAFGSMVSAYGPNFTHGCADDEKLSDVLHKLDEPSLSSLIHDHEAGKLDQICRDKAA